MEVGVEPLHLPSLAQSDHGNAHHKTPAAQCRFEKLAIPLTREENDRVDLLDAVLDPRQNAFRPRMSFLDRHRDQRSLIGPDFFVWMK